MSSSTMVTRCIRHERDERRRGGGLLARNMVNPLDRVLNRNSSKYLVGSIEQVLGILGGVDVV